MSPMKQVRPILNPDKDWSAAHAFDPSRPLPRSALTPEQNAAIPWGDHPDDDNFITVEVCDLRSCDQPRDIGSCLCPEHRERATEQSRRDVHR